MLTKLLDGSSGMLNASPLLMEAVKATAQNKTVKVFIFQWCLRSTNSNYKEKSYRFVDLFTSLVASHVDIFVSLIGRAPENPSEKTGVGRLKSWFHLFEKSQKWMSRVRRSLPYQIWSQWIQWHGWGKIKSLRFGTCFCLLSRMNLVWVATTQTRFVVVIYYKQLTAKLHSTGLYDFVLREPGITVKHFIHCDSNFHTELPNMVSSAHIKLADLKSGNLCVSLRRLFTRGCVTTA